MTEGTQYGPRAAGRGSPRTAWAHSGPGIHGGNGGACHKSSYTMPWADNFCERRPHATLFCPGGRGHQGVDIRPPLCRDKAAIAVAVEDGTLMGINPRTSSVTLKGAKMAAILKGTVDIQLPADQPVA